MKMQTQWADVMSTFCIQTQLIDTIMHINSCFALRSTGRQRIAIFKLSLQFLGYVSLMLGKYTDSASEIGTVTSKLQSMTLQTFCVMTAWTKSSLMWHMRSLHWWFLVHLMWQQCKKVKHNNLPEVPMKVAKVWIAIFNLWCSDGSELTLIAKSISTTSNKCSWYHKSGSKQKRSDPTNWHTNTQNDCIVKSAKTTAFKCLECVPILLLCNNGVCLLLHHLAIQNEMMGWHCEPHFEQRGLQSRMRRESW